MTKMICLGILMLKMYAKNISGWNGEEENDPCADRAHAGGHVLSEIFTGEPGAEGDRKTAKEKNGVLIQRGRN